jgi:hypothetical protein
MKYEVGAKVRLLKNKFVGDRTYVAGSVAVVQSVRSSANAYGLKFGRWSRTYQVHARYVATCSLEGETGHNDPPRPKPTQPPGPQSP